MSSKFIISNDDFVNRSLFAQQEAEEETEKIESDQSVVITAASIQEDNVDMNVSLQEVSIIPQEQGFEELNQLAIKEDISKPRTPLELGLTKKPDSSILSTMVADIFENCFKSSEAVVASRLAYSQQISDIVRDYDTLANAILLLAETYNVIFPMRKIDHTTMEIMEVNIPVTRTGNFTAHELALISILLRRKMDSFPQTAKEMSATIEALSNETKFKDAQLVALRARVKDLTEAKPTVVSVFYIKRQGKNRFLSLEGKRIRSFRELTPACLFTSRVDAEAALVYAIKNQEKTKVKKILTYEVVQLVHGSTVTSPKVQEAIKNAYK